RRRAALRRRALGARRDDDRRGGGGVIEDEGSKRARSEARTRSPQDERIPRRGSLAEAIDRHLPKPPRGKTTLVRELDAALVAVPLCLAGACAAGAAIGAAIGAARVRGAHEVISSIMLNKIVGGVALWIGNALLFRGGTTHGPAIAPGAELPQLGLGGSAANLSVLIAAAAVAGVWWLRSRSTWGQAWLAVGRDPAAARAVGISVGRVQIAVM